MEQSKTKFHEYLPVGEREMDWGFYVTALGFNRVEPGESFNAASHPVAYQFDPGQGRYLPEYQLAYITGGRGILYSEKSGEIELAAGSAFMLFPDVWHSYHPDPKTGWEDYWVGFNGSYIYELCRRNLFSPDRPVFRPRRPELLVDAFERLFRSVRESSIENSMLYGANVLEILALVSEPEEESQDELAGKRGIVDEAIHLIWGWSYRTISVEDICRRLRVNRRTLERYFREVLDRTVLDEIVRCRLARARRLLDSTRIPIGRIAMMAGFSSSLQMRRCFQRTFGTTPEQYRHSVR